jgi:hypothetical protein
MSFVPRTKLVFSEIGQGLKIKELYTTLIFQAILTSVVPTFTTYLYFYYTLDPGRSFTNFQFAMLQLLGNATMIPAGMLYNLYLRETEFRTMMLIACFTNFFGAFTTMLYSCPWQVDFGYPYIFTMMTATVTDVLYMCFIQLPLCVLFAKLIPERIESSLFAFSTGLMNLSNLFVAPDLGNLINVEFVHAQVGEDANGKPTIGNLNQTMWKLYAIQSVLSIVPTFFVWLLPKRANVGKV